jgi:xanthine dehydrogenase iron-sulfur cluster and FAD-binding subunit A
MSGACSMQGRDENASAYKVLVGNFKGEDHLRNLGVEGTILITEGKDKGKVVPVHDMKAVEVELHAFLTSLLDLNG